MTFYANNETLKYKYKFESFNPFSIIYEIIQIHVFNPASTQTTVVNQFDSKLAEEFNGSIKTIQLDTLNEAYSLIYQIVNPNTFNCNNT
jgi:hypothetical protein